MSSANGLGAMVGPVVAAVCSALLVTPSRAEVTFVPRVGSSVTWTDNIDLARINARKKSDFVFELTPAASVDIRTARTRATADYELNYLQFVDASERQQTFHNLSAESVTTLVDQWFTLDALAEYDQQLIDPTVGNFYGGLFSFSNVTDAFTGRLTPRLDHLFSWGRVQAAYSLGTRDYRDGGLEDSRDTAINLSVLYGDPERRASLLAGYGTQTTEYDRSDSFRFDTAYVDLFVRVGRSLRLLGEVGQESDFERDPSGGGLGSEYWRAGFEWKPDRDNELLFLVGDRFFGTTYEGSWRRRTQYLETEFSYREEPTTQSREFVLRPLSLGSAGLAPTLQTFAPGQEFSRVTSDVYISKALRGSIGLVGRLTSIRFAVRDETREYIASLGSDDTKQYRLQVSRRLGPALELTISGQIDRVDLREAVDYEERDYGLALTRDFGSSLTGEIAASRVERKGQSDGYDVNWIRVGVTKTFGRR